MPPRERSRKPAVPLEEQVLKKNAKEEVPESIEEELPKAFLSSGCGLFNCALTDSVIRGWPCGRIVNLIGDSDTGKTVLALTALAEACRNPKFNDHTLIYADVEEALSMDLEEMFGKNLVSHLDLRSIGNPDNLPPVTVQELHYQIMDLIEDEKPFIYVVDSLDALPSKEELEKSEEQRQAWKKGKDASGTYQMSKQKYLSSMFRELKGEIGKTDSLLIIISQTRDAIGNMFQPKTRSGGNAMKFYASHEVWLSVAQSDKVRGRTIGRQIRTKISKNRITGKKREIHLWIYDNLGVDNIRTSIDFLVTEGHWTKIGGWVQAKEFDTKLQVKDLVKHIESNNLETKLSRIVQRLWSDIEKSLELGRKARYE